MENWKKNANRQNPQINIIRVPTVSNAFLELGTEEKRAAKEGEPDIAREEEEEEEEMPAWGVGGPVLAAVVEEEVEEGEEVEDAAAFSRLARTQVKIPTSAAA